MLIPMRCFSCGKPISQFWEEFQDIVNNKGEDAGKVLDDFGFKRYCCRSMFLGQEDTLQLVNKFKKF